ncbi:MAG: hypothetical protein GQ574_11735 [Crocinitomix sp.]|nr:hypothetical protein [Crocinitomix sp.]
MKINLILIAFTFCSITHAQTNELGIVPFKLEKNGETLNHHFEPKFLTGLYYQRTFSRLHWISSVEYGENSIDDGCNSCADHVTGTGLFKELNVYTGLGIQWDLPIEFGVLQFLTRVKATAMAYNYSGYFSGGWGGYNLNLDRRYYLLGGEIEIGVAYYLPSNFVFRMDAGFRRGVSWAKDRYPLFSNVIREGTSALIAPKLSIGYRF